MELIWFSVGMLPLACRVAGLGGVLGKGLALKEIVLVLLEKKWLPRDSLSLAFCFSTGFFFPFGASKDEFATLLVDVLVRANA